jgi:hypothetical protein
MFDHHMGHGRSKRGQVGIGAVVEKHTPLLHTPTCTTYMYFNSDGFAQLLDYLRGFQDG